MWLFWYIYFSYRRYYSHAFIFVTWDKTVTADNDTDVAFKNFAPYSTCKTEITNVFIDEANHTYIAMSMYNLVEYSDNYSDKSGSLWQFKKEEPPANTVDLNVNNGVFKSESKYKSALIRKTTYAVNNTYSSKIVVPLKYLINFWRSLEMSLINSKIHLELNWIENYILSSDGNSLLLYLLKII